MSAPDETLALKYSPPDPTVDVTVDGQPVRRLYPVRDDATPLYVQEPGARVGTSLTEGDPIFDVHAQSRGELAYALAYVAAHPDIYEIL